VGESRRRKEERRGKETKKKENPARYQIVDIPKLQWHLTTPKKVDTGNPK
jgi:hypothetical protein